MKSGTRIKPEITGSETNMKIRSNREENVQSNHPLTNDHEYIKEQPQIILQTRALVLFFRRSLIIKWNAVQSG
jgi:hypothetical protein